MSRFYTNVYLFKDEILLRGYEEGQRVQQSIPYTPYLFVNSRTRDSEFRTLSGHPVDKLEFDSVRVAREFCEKYKEIENFPVHGLRNFVYTFIRDHYPGEIQYDQSKISVVSIDIETATEGGFPNIETANQPIISISLRKNGRTVVFGFNDYTPKSENVIYIKCGDETALLEKFLTTWESSQFSPDIVTGWNIEAFDIPYLVRRIRFVLDDKAAKRLSPWGKLNSRKYENGFGKEMEVFEPVGLAVLDYMLLYKKFSYTPQESYRLDHIAQYELGENKLDYSMYESMHEFYVKDFERFIDYNIHDVVLVDRLEEKMGFIKQVCALAFDAKVNLVDALTTVRMWDVIIHNYLLDKGTVIHHFEVDEKAEVGIEGAYVKDPINGFHDWVVSFDLNSLYPHLIMQYNISPETYRGMISGITVDGILNGQLNEPHIQKKMAEENIAVAATGCYYDRDFKGFLPTLMAKMYDDRSAWKKRMIAAKKKYEETPTKELEYEIAMCHNMQMAKKIQLNSAYGALGNRFFRWFDRKYAESITKSGQVSIRWMENNMNAYLNKLMKTEDVDYVIACDTDSMYLRLGPIINKVFPDGGDVHKMVEAVDQFAEQKIQPVIDKAYGELAKYVNAFEQKMFMKREAIANKGIWTGKKHYILNVYDLEGVRYQEPKLKIMGIEAVRSSTPSACRTNIKKALEIIMNTDEVTTQKFIADFRKEYMSLPFEEVAFPRSVKGLAKWARGTSYEKGCPIHVRASLTFNNLIKSKKLDKRIQLIQDGEKIKFAYLKMPNPVGENVIATTGELPKELDLQQHIDYNKQFDKSFIEPLSTILGAIGWHPEKISSLDAFFV